MSTLVEYCILILALVKIFPKLLGHLGSIDLLITNIITDYKFSIKVWTESGCNTEKIGFVKAVYVTEVFDQGSVEFL